MKALGRWSVAHRVSGNLIMVFLIVAGLYTAMTMKREMFPQFSMDMVHICVPYPGASPEEVEEGICIRIEEQLKSLEDVKAMYSTAIEGNGSVIIELESGTDISEKLDEVRTEIDLLLKNGIQGIVLVFVVLALFLDLGLAFWVASGIPITIYGRVSGARVPGCLREHALLVRIFHDPGHPGG